jgi:ADP-ribose pyrophosphatase YjhB (NUDIX family)
MNSQASIGDPPPSTYPRVGVGVCVFKDDCLLLIRRGKAPRAGEWSLPGGAQELGETIHEAGQREVLEETNIQIRILGLVDVVDLIERKPGSTAVAYHFTLIDLVADWCAGEPVAASDATDARWASMDRLHEHDLWDETLRVAAKAFSLWRASKQ